MTATGNLTKAWTAKLVKRGEWSQTIEVLGDDIVEAALTARTKVAGLKRWEGWTIEGIEII